MCPGQLPSDVCALLGSILSDRVVAPCHRESSGIYPWNTCNHTQAPTTSSPYAHNVRHKFTFPLTSFFAFAGWPPRMLNNRKCSSRSVSPYCKCTAKRKKNKWKTLCTFDESCVLIGGSEEMLCLCCQMHSLPTAPSGIPRKRVSVRNIRGRKKKW